MTEIVADMSSLDKTIKKMVSVEAERAAIRELVVAARARGGDLTGPGGLLKTLTKTVLETALEEEISEHSGHRKQPGRVQRFDPAPGHRGVVRPVVRTGDARSPS
jgi:putative transposase